MILVRNGRTARRVIAQSETILPWSHNLLTGEFTLQLEDENRIQWQVILTASEAEQLHGFLSRRLYPATEGPSR